ncbi:ACT domain-containing protein [Bailinhaonella thermotolerans]|uniref:ACT domain-containing protein n=1 Tax=Bailinhaonella thermotolerans TaxID=1070861 RepID=A0A3A4AZ35_9ACTN|nr:ACT domain-containing protein [Bailinhaonella thermotolerans]RJL35942.1 ACT domain-containing protein [Bailinhaonella thermotolerans]
MNPPPAQRLRVVAPLFLIEELPHGESPGDDWIAQVRTPEGTTVVRTAAPGSAGDLWTGFYGAATAHDLDVPGMLAAIVNPLAEAAIPVFVASTVQADLVLVPRSTQPQAVAALQRAGHEIDPTSTPTTPF